MLPRIGARQQHIMELIRAHGPRHVRQLSDALGISAVAVRHHLAGLQEQGLLRTTRERLRVGRPRQLFDLSPQAERLLADGEAALAPALLRHIHREYGGEAVQAALRSVTREWEAELLPWMADSPLPERVRRLAAGRSRHGFAAGAEQNGDGSFTLCERRCPLRELVTEFPQVCDCERRMMESLLGVPVTLEKRLLDGYSACEYRILAKADPPAG